MVEKDKKYYEDLEKAEEEKKRKRDEIKKDRENKKWVFANFLKIFKNYFLDEHWIITNRKYSPGRIVKRIWAI